VWKGYVTEKADVALRCLCPNQLRGQQQVVVVNPDEVGIVCVIDDDIGKLLVGLLIVRAVFIIKKVTFIRKIMEQWPNTGIGVTLVIVVNFFLREGHRGKTLGQAVGRGVGVGHQAFPAHPQAVNGLQHRVKGSHQPTRIFNQHHIVSFHAYSVRLGVGN
jgi:hypothetical protein